MVEKSPDAFRNISEVASLLEIPAHVLRFWETRFSEIKPVKRSGRRYYRPEDIALLQRIRALLYEQGYTIKGAQQILKDKSNGKNVNGANSEASSPDASTNKKQALTLLRKAEEKLKNLA